MLKKKTGTHSGMTHLGFFQDQPTRHDRHDGPQSRPQKNIDETTEIRGLCLAAEAQSLSTLLISSTCADASLISLGGKMLSPWDPLKVGRLTNQLILEIQNKIQNQTRLLDSMNYE